MKKTRVSKVAQLQAEVDRLNRDLTLAMAERDENVAIYKTNLAAKDKQLAELNKTLSDAIMHVTHVWENLTGKRIILPVNGISR